MKRIFALILTLLLTASLAGCGAASSSTQPETDAPEDAPEAVQPEAPQETTTEEDVAVTEDETESGKTLVAYFSWSGNTETLAGMVQEAAGGDLFEILPETPYTDDYNELLDVAQAEQGDNARPALAAQVENWEEYDTVFVGYPNWWGDAPMIIRSFLESYDCTGKTIVPFATSGGGGLGRGVSSITASAAGATVLEGFHVSGSRVDSASADVTAWVDSLGL